MTTNANGSWFKHAAMASLTALAAVGCASSSPPAQGVWGPPSMVAPAPAQVTERASPTAIAGPEASAVTFERMAHWPEPGWQVPRSVDFSPDGKWVTYLQSEKQNEETSLYVFDRETKENRVLLRASDLAADAPMSREEELRRERQRQKNKGVTSYRWAKRAPMLVIPMGGDVYARMSDGKVVKLTNTKEPELDPQPCDSGQRIAYVREGELYAMDVASQKETQLTKGAPEGVTRGLSDFNGQEEFDEAHGFWWSPKCDRIAYLEVDERAVDRVPVVGYRDQRADVMMQRYPAAGGRNPLVHLAVVDVATRTTKTVQLPGADKERYLARFSWAPDGRALFFQALSRDQRRLELVRVEPAGAAVRVLATDTSPVYVEFSRILPLENSAHLLYVRERDGFRHIDLLDATSGARVAEVTAGKWDVDKVAGIDEAEGRVLFTATKDSPVERHAYSASWKTPGEPKRLTNEPGYHEIKKDDASSAWFDLHSALDRTPRTAIHDGNGATLGQIPCPLDNDLDALQLRSPELVTVRGPSGDTLYGALLEPRQMIAGKRYPVVVMVYGGPHVQAVQNRWSPNLMWQHLADRGVVVFQLDNRGTPARGRAFEQATNGRLGELELTDQLAGLDYLATLPFVDATRVGIYGHSYGGFMAALALLRAPTRFHVGVAGSPVVDWHLYDTGYTERYMGAPNNNAAGYAANDLATMAPALTGKLFLLHAMMDENVHFQNSARLIEALTHAQKPFDMLLFPGERHGYRNPLARQYALMRVAEYFAHNL